MWFELSRDWGENRLIKELLNVFPADCKEDGFEFVKNWWVYCHTKPFSWTVAPYGNVYVWFELSKDWGENRFIKELLNVFPADCKEDGFEFVKNW